MQINHVTAMPAEPRLANKLKKARKIEIRLTFDWRGKNWLPSDVLQNDGIEISSDIDTRLILLSHLKDITKTAQASKISLSTLWASGGALREAFEETNSVTNERFWMLAKKYLSGSEVLENSFSTSQTSAKNTVAGLSDDSRPADWKRRTIKLRTSRGEPDQEERVEVPNPSVSSMQPAPAKVCPSYLIEKETSCQLKQRIVASTSKLASINSHMEVLNADIASLNHAAEGLDALQRELATTFDTYHSRFTNQHSQSITAGTSETTTIPGLSEANKTNEIAGFLQEESAQFKERLETRRQSLKISVEESISVLANTTKESEKLDVELNLLKDICRLKETMERHPDAWKM